MRTLGKRLILQREAPDQETQSGLVIPEKYQNTSKVVGQVVAVGEELTSLKAGDRVVFDPRSALETDIGQVKYIFIHVDGILGVL